MIVEAILCDWCQKRIPPESGVATQIVVAEQTTGNRYRFHLCNDECYDKWCIAHKHSWEDFKE